MLGVRVWDPRYARTTGLPTFLRVSITDITVGDFCSFCGKLSVRRHGCYRSRGVHDMYYFAG